MTSDSNPRQGQHTPTGFVPSNNSAVTLGSVSAKAKPRTRLTREASRILLDAFESGLTNPDPREKQELLREIHGTPGNEDYQIRSLSVWFTNKRSSQKAKTVQAATASNSPTTIQSSHHLKPDKIPLLEKLFRSTPGNNPPQDLIDTWAVLLEADSSVVSAWVANEKEKLKLASNIPFSTGSISSESDPQRNILTPSSSTSPEPPYSSFVTIKEERKPLIIPNLSPTTDPVRRDILLAIHHEFEFSDPQRQRKQYPRPKTRKELNALFSSCTRPMEEFLERVKNGSLEKFRFKREWATTM